MSVPTRSATSRDAAGSICCHPSATRLDGTSFSAWRATSQRWPRHPSCPSVPSTRRWWPPSEGTCTSGASDSTSDATDQNRLWLRTLDVRFERESRSGADPGLRLRLFVRLPLTSGLQSFSARNTTTTRPRPSSAAGMRPDDRRRERRLVDRVDAFEVERRSSSSTSPDRSAATGHLRLIVADDQVERIWFAFGNLLANGRWCRRRHLVSGDPSDLPELTSANTATG